MQDHVRILSRNTRITDDMNHRNEFAIVTCHTAVRRKLSRSKCRYKSGSALHPSISIGGIRRNQLVWIASPVKVIVRNEIEQCKLIV